MLRGRIDDAIGAEFERLLQERRRENVVDDKPRPAGMHDLRDPRNIEHVEAGIGRALEECSLGFRPHGGAPLRQIGAIN